MKFSQILNKRQLNCVLLLFVVVFFSFSFEIFSHGLFSLSWTANRRWRSFWFLSQKRKKTEWRTTNCSLFFWNMFDTWSVSFYVMYVITISIYCISPTGVLLLLLLLKLFFCFHAYSQSHNRIRFLFERNKKKTLRREAHTCYPVNILPSLQRLLLVAADKWTWRRSFYTVVYLQRYFKIWNIICPLFSLHTHKAFAICSSSCSSSSSKSNKLRISPNECGHRRANKYI